MHPAARDQGRPRKALSLWDAESDINPGLKESIDRIGLACVASFVSQEIWNDEDVLPPNL